MIHQGPFAAMNAQLINQIHTMYSLLQYAAMFFIAISIFKFFCDLMMGNLNVGRGMARMSFMFLPPLVLLPLAADLEVPAGLIASFAFLGLMGLGAQALYGASWSAPEPARSSHPQSAAPDVARQIAAAVDVMNGQPTDAPIGQGLDLRKSPEAAEPAASVRNPQGLALDFTDNGETLSSTTPAGAPKLNLDF